MNAFHLPWPGQQSYTAGTGASSSGTNPASRNTSTPFLGTQPSSLVTSPHPSSVYIPIIPPNVNFVIQPTLSSPIKLGMFAAQTIFTGTHVFNDNCLISVPRDDDHDAFLHEYQKLSNDEKDFFQMVELPMGEPDPFFTFKIRAWPHDGKFGIFPTQILVNHSSQANAYSSYNVLRRCITLYATRRISPGEEVTVSYCHPFLKLPQRQRLLAPYSIWIPTDSEREDRLSIIRKLKRNVEQFPLPSVETMDDLTRITRLMEQDGLLSPNLAFHYRQAAEMQANIDQYTSALVFARRGREVLRICVGSHSEDFIGISEFVRELETAEVAAMTRLS